MLNLIKLEFYKLRKQRIFKILLLVVVGISIFSMLSQFRISETSGVLITGKSSYENAFCDIFMLFVSAIFAGFYIGSDFTNRTIQSQLSSGHSRLDIFISKSVVFFMGTSLIMILYPLTAGLISTIKFGWGEAFTATSIIYILRLAVLGILLNIGTTSFYVLFGFLCKDVPKTICMCMAFPVVFSVFSSTLGHSVPVVGRILNYSTLAQLNNIVSDTISPQAVIVVLLSAVITALVILTWSNMIFAKAEIK